MMSSADVVRAGRSCETNATPAPRRAGANSVPTRPPLGLVELHLAGFLRWGCVEGGRFRLLSEQRVRVDHEPATSGAADRRRLVAGRVRPRIVSPRQAPPQNTARQSRRLLRCEASSSPSSFRADPMRLGTADASLGHAEVRQIERCRPARPWSALFRRKEKRGSDGLCDGASVELHRRSTCRDRRGHGLAGVASTSLAACRKAKRRTYGIERPQRRRRHGAVIERSRTLSSSTDRS